MNVKPYEVEFSGTVEELLQTPIFYDELRSEQLYEQPEALQPQELGARRALGSAAIRLIATARTEQRMLARRLNPNLDVREWNKHQPLTKKYLADVAIYHKSAVQHLARQMALVNKAEKVLASDELHDITAGLRASQPQYVHDALQAVAIGPLDTALVLDDGTIEACKLRGTAIVAPTGYGKTEIMGRIARALGVGKPIDGVANDKRPVRLLIIEPTQNLVDQVASVSGDKTFERASGIRPGRYFQHEKDDSSMAVVITQDKFIDDFKDGALNDHVFDMLMVDEAHRITAPLLSQTVLSHWRGLLFGFTATPEYNTYKDARRILPHVIEYDDVVSGIKDGYLNGAQLFTLVVTKKSMTDDHLNRAEADLRVVEFLEPLLAEGRRGIIFCEQGERSVHARWLANRLSKIELPNGRNVCAKAIGTFTRQSAKVIEAYHREEVDVLTTVKMGSLGLNAAFDFVYINRHITSLLECKQIIGRGTRVSDYFPYTIFGQTIIADESKRGCSIYEAFDVEEVEQGMVIGPIKKGKHTHTVDYKQYTGELRAILDRANHRATGELFISPEVQTHIPDGYMPFYQLIADLPLGYMVARRRLDDAGFDWVGSLDPKRKRMTRYYEPAARAYLEEGVASHARPTDVFRLSDYTSVFAIGKEYGLGWRTLKKVVEGSKVAIHQRRTARFTQMYISRIDESHLRKFLEEMLPLAEPGAATIKQLAEEFQIDGKALFKLASRHGIKTIPMRHPDNNGSDRFYTAEDTVTLRAEFHKRQAHPEAGPGSMSIRGLGAVLNIDPRNVAPKLTDEEKAQAQLRWIDNRKGVSMLLPTWTAAEAQSIIARLQREYTKYPEAKPDDMTPRQVAQALGVDSKTLYNYLRTEQRNLTLMKRARDKTGAIILTPCWSATDAANVIGTIAVKLQKRGK